MKQDAIQWFEIPATDLARAQAFYEGLLGQTLRRESMLGAELAIFASTEDGATGCLMAGPTAPPPGTVGALVYLAAPAPLQAALDRVQQLGGRVDTPVTQLPPGMGCFARIVDSEGNRVGLAATA